MAQVLTDNVAGHPPTRGLTPNASVLSPRGFGSAGSAAMAAPRRRPGDGSLSHMTCFVTRSGRRTAGALPPLRRACRARGIVADRVHRGIGVYGCSETRFRSWGEDGLPRDRRRVGDADQTVNGRHFQSQRPSLPRRNRPPEPSAQPWGYEYPPRESFRSFTLRRISPPLEICERPGRYAGRSSLLPPSVRSFYASRSANGVRPRTRCTSGRFTRPVVGS